MTALAVVLSALQYAATRARCRAPTYSVRRGRTFDYTAKMGMLWLGSASIQVVSIDTVRGQPAWYFRFSAVRRSGHLQDHQHPRIVDQRAGFHSLRFRRDSQENSKQYLRDYEIFADSGYYRQRQASATTPTTAEPLDDASLLYFVRITPLVVGQSYRLARHFMPELNPIVVNVLKRETISSPTDQDSGTGPQSCGRREQWALRKPGRCPALDHRRCPADSGADPLDTAVGHHHDEARQDDCRNRRTLT